MRSEGYYFVQWKGQPAGSTEGWTMAYWSGECWMVVGDADKHFDTEFQDSKRLTEQAPADIKVKI